MINFIRTANKFTFILFPQNVNRYTFEIVSKFLREIDYIHREISLPSPQMRQVSAAKALADSRDAVPHAHVLYTNVDNQRDKLVTDDRHQFITLTVQSTTSETIDMQLRNFSSTKF